MVHWYITKSYTRKDKWVSCAAGVGQAMVVEVETHSHQATSQAREIKLTEG